MERSGAAVVAEPEGLLILGGGGHGRVVAEIAADLGIGDLVWLDDDPAAASAVIGPLARCAEPELRQRYGRALVAIGRAPLRLQWLDRLQQLGFACPPLVHPRAWVSPTAQLGAGTVVMPQAAVMAGARLGQGCIVNTGASVDHDCDLADGVHVCPGAHLAGAVVVGRGSWIGIGASVIQGRRIGAAVTVGAGAAVVHDLADGVTAAGVPARVLGPSSPP
ncbi:MAG: pilin glycosylation protein [Cyanobacteria bacterium K_Offshore_0m_m2_072]|nr:pilin glycosylation protein [Cyanobacteria bacterium K_Offshore_0m_m2_072]